MYCRLQIMGAECKHRNSVDTSSTDGFCVVHQITYNIITEIYVHSFNISSLHVYVYIHECVELTELPNHVPDRLL